MTIIRTHEDVVERVTDLGLGLELLYMADGTLRLAHDCKNVRPGSSGSPKRSVKIALRMTFTSRSGVPAQRTFSACPSETHTTRSIQRKLKRSILS